MLTGYWKAIPPLRLWEASRSPEYQLTAEVGVLDILRSVPSVCVPELGALEVFFRVRLRERSFFRVLDEDSLSPEDFLELFSELKDTLLLVLVVLDVNWNRFQAS